MLTEMPIANARSKSAGAWSYSKLEVAIASSGERIDLLDGS